MKSNWFTHTLFPFLGVLGLLAVISITFWQEELRYLLPTPIPSNYQVIELGDKVSLPQLIEHSGQKPIFLHFFNPECPCSRFNMQHFSYLFETYQEQVSFFAVLPGIRSTKAIHDFKMRYSLDIPVILDKKEKLAESCGVYSTPQAALLQSDGSLYYRGNYNRSRYCLNQQFNFAQMAIDSVLAGQSPPHFVPEATQSYGCSLTSQDSLQKYSFSFWPNQ